MSRNLIRISVPLIGGAALALAFLGCSSDTTTNNAATGGATGSGGTAAGGGGTTGSGGSAGGATGTGGSKGGAGGVGGAGPDLYECQAAPKRDPGGTGAKDATCCGGVGKCVEDSTLSATMKAALGHDTCGPTLKCAPPASTGDAGAPKHCTSATLGGLEGRCLPKCFVLGNPQADMLKQDDCGAGTICAPCYNPLDATDTGACSQNGDTPTAAKPTPYQTCGTYDGGSEGGVCVPKTLVDASGDPSAPNLKQDDCASATDRCVPTLKAKDPHQCFEKCTTTLKALNTPGKDYGPGACVPSYIVRDVNPGGLAILKKDTCAGADELCAPCLDPLSMPNSGEPTHSCEAPPVLP